MINYIRNLSPLDQVIAINTIGTTAIVLGMAWGAKAETITPQTQPDCQAIVCTMGGASLGATVTITPKATITQVCRPDGCVSSWVGHETDEGAIGVEPEVFVIPEGDRR